MKETLTNMPRRHQRRSRPLLTLTLLCLCSTTLLAQSKLLTLDDIYDPVKRVNFNGQPPLNLQWLKTEILSAKPQGSIDRHAAAFKVNAVTGEAAPFTMPRKWKRRSHACRIQAPTMLKTRASFHLSNESGADRRAP
jgi:hypothetical protein